LTDALNADDIKAEAAELIRGLIDKVALTPIRDGVRAELYGALAAILVVCDQLKDELPGSGPGSLLSVVAGACNHLNLLFDAPRLNAPVTP
jgi:hypothetical protein